MAAKAKYTYEDYLNTPEGERYELLDGELYAKDGVEEYWVADPVHKMVSVMLLRDGVLELAGTYVEGDTVVATALEGFSVGVGEIF